MFDIIALILIAIFVPIISLVGIKIYNLNTKKTTIFFTLLFLGLELFRFFYNAKFYANGITPVKDLTFSYITIICIVALFATFNKGKLGTLFKNIFFLTCLVPIIVALFNKHTYTNVLDTFTVTKALYFVEVGVVLTLALLYAMQAGKIKSLNIVWSKLFVIGFAVISYLITLFWNSEFVLVWYIIMISIAIISVDVVYLAYFIYNKYFKPKTEITNK